MVPNTTMELGQVTVLFNTMQSLGAYDSKNKLVAGIDQPIALDEYLVFERALHTKDQSAWRICGKLEPQT